MARIQILGIGCKKSRALKANLMAALERTGVDASVEEVTEVNRILQFQILSAPALFINGELFYQGVAPEVEELEHLLRNYARQSGGRPRRILVPVDFSATAANAFRYAWKFAARHDAALEVLHVCHPSLEKDATYRNNPKGEDRHRKESRLRTFIANNGEETPPGAGGVWIDPLVATGFPVEEIVRHSAESDLIVMGTEGRDDVLEKIFGSTASEVARRAICPVMLVPPQASFRDFRTVLFATDEEEVNEESLLRRFSELMGDMPAHIHFVQAATEEGASYTVREAAFEPAVRNRLPGQNLQVVRLECENAPEGLTRYAGDHQADLIVMSTRLYHLLGRLFHPSLSRRRAPAPAFPLLVFQNS